MRYEILSSLAEVLFTILCASLPTLLTVGIYLGLTMN